MLQGTQIPVGFLCWNLRQAVAVGFCTVLVIYHIFKYPNVSVQDLKSEIKIKLFSKTESDPNQEYRFPDKPLNWNRIDD